MSVTLARYFIIGFLSVNTAIAIPAAYAELEQQINMINERKQSDKVGPLLRQQLQGLPRVQSRERESGPIDNAAMVRIDAVASHDADRLLSQLQALGLHEGRAFGRMVSGRLPLAQITAASSLGELHHIYLHQSNSRTGAVTSQGVQSMQVVAGRANFGVDGSGITVGVISDSYDCYAQSDAPDFIARSAATDKASGDLPSGAYALEELSECDFGIDEGRALMQVIHDIAPGAELVFLSGANGIASTASGIVRLVDEVGVDLIVDDTASPGETYFQDGPIAQAIDYAVSQGVVYISAAGNSGRLGYQSAYRAVADTNLNVNAHDFDPGPDIDVFQAFTLPPGEGIGLDLQWASAAYSVSGPPGAATDLDIFILNEAATDILASATEINLNKDPSEFIQFFNPENASENTFNLLITKAAGPDPILLKFVLQGRFNGRFNEYATQSGTVVGRANSAYAIAVGAARYSQTPAFGALSPILQSFSSAGGDTPILFDRNGELLSTPQFRQNPHIVGPDDVNTTFFLFSREDIDSDNDGLPNFLGTSASAPHVAGVVALLLELNPNFQPQDILAILQASSIDMTLRNTDLTGTGQTSIVAGYDSDSGAGLVDANAALALANTYPPSAAPPLNASSDINNIKISSGGGSSGPWLIIILLMMTILKKYGYWHFPSTPHKIVN